MKKQQRSTPEIALYLAAKGLAEYVHSQPWTASRDDLTALRAARDILGNGAPDNIEDALEAAK